jgi:hypothetical protein
MKDKTKNSSSDELFSLLTKSKDKEEKEWYYKKAR